MPHFYPVKVLHIGELAESMMGSRLSNLARPRIRSYRRRSHLKHAWNRAPLSPHSHLADLQRQNPLALLRMCRTYHRRYLGRHKASQLYFD